MQRCSEQPSFVDLKGERTLGVARVLQEALTFFFFFFLSFSFYKHRCCLLINGFTLATYSGSD